MIKFAGIRSDEMNLIIEHYPSKEFPERSYEVIEVPGRDGDIVIDNGNFKNYRQSYSVFIDATDPDEATYQMVTRKIAGWLLSNPGYQRLEDSYDPEFYRMAYYSGGTNFSNFFNVYGRGSLEFTCAPRRFYKFGEKEIQLTNGQVLRSPSDFIADPIYRVKPSAPYYVGLTVNGKTVYFQAVDDEHGDYCEFIVDVQKHTSKVSVRPFLNTNVRMTEGYYEDLRLSKSSTIEFENCSSVHIIPRWWSL